MKVLSIAALVMAVGTAACTKPNPNVCCDTPDDCAAVGLPAGSTCASNLTCDQHACVEPTCAIDADCPIGLDPFSWTPRLRCILLLIESTLEVNRTEILIV